MGGFAGPDMKDTRINAGSLKQGRASPGGAYDTNRKWSVRGDFNLVEVEVYCNGNIEPSSEGGGKCWPW
jgi:hypothetical protein